MPTTEAGPPGNVELATLSPEAWDKIRREESASHLSLKLMEGDTCQVIGVFHSSSVSGSVLSHCSAMCADTTGHNDCFPKLGYSGRQAMAKHC